MLVLYQQMLDLFDKKPKSLQYLPFELEAKKIKPKINIKSTIRKSFQLQKSFKYKFFYMRKRNIKNKQNYKVSKKSITILPPLQLKTFRAPCSIQRHKCWSPELQSYNLATLINHLTNAPTKTLKTLSKSRMIGKLGQ